MTPKKVLHKYYTFWFGVAGAIFDLSDFPSKNFAMATDMCNLISAIQKTIKGNSVESFLETAIAFRAEYDHEHVDQVITYVLKGIGRTDLIPVMQASSLLEK